LSLGGNLGLHGKTILPKTPHFDKGKCPFRPGKHGTERALQIRLPCA
jgi:hypothetical protein